MSTDAEKRAYSRGYACGRKRLKREIGAEQQAQKAVRFWQRAMIAALPVAAQQSTWKRGENPISSIDDRMALAADFADSALAVARNRGRI